MTTSPHSNRSVTITIAVFTISAIFTSLYYMTFAAPSQVKTGTQVETAKSGKETDSMHIKKSNESTASTTTPIAGWTPDPAVTAMLASTPELLKQKLEESMRALVKSPKLLEITLDAYDSTSTSLGKLKRVFVHTEGGEIDGLVLHKASFDFQDVQLDTTKLIKESKIDPVQVGSIDMDVIILESDLNEFLKKKSSKINVRNPRVDIDNGEIKLSGSTKYGLVRVNFWASGNFEVKNFKEIWFHAKKLKLNNMSMPRSFVGSIIKQINPVLNLDKFPFHLNLKEIRTEKGSLHFISSRQGS